MSLRRLPAVFKLAEDPALAPEVERHGRDAVVAAARVVIEAARAQLKEGRDAPEQGELALAARARLHERPAPFRRVINATGVILHTNLGRAPLADAAWEAMAAARGYCDLEMDLAQGKRASRLRAVEAPLVELTGAEAGTVVNNNAAAVLLALAALAGSKATAVSRGHLVEIGGGFRLPEIMRASGSPLLEIGTTNRTHTSDYAEALAQGAGLVLLVHRSNFVMQGYVSEPEPTAIVALAREHNVPVALDLGSGALIDTERYGLPAELSVAKAVAMGFDLVCFSGDKLLGGPQAGYLVGKRGSVDAVRCHPLARAVRCDKLQLAGILATLELYQRAEATRHVPIWRLLSQTPERLRVRATAWQQELGCGEVVRAAGAVGGGSLPEGTLEGFALALASANAEALLAALRRQSPPVVGHIAGDRVLLHPRSVDDKEDAELRAAVKTALARVAPA